MRSKASAPRAVQMSRIDFRPDVLAFICLTTSPRAILAASVATLANALGCAAMLRRTANPSISSAIQRLPGFLCQTTKQRNDACPPLVAECGAGPGPAKRFGDAGCL